MRLRALFLASALAASPIVAMGQSAKPEAIEFAGAGSPIALKVDALKALPQVERTISFKTSKGQKTATYKGPLLWNVVQSTKALEGLGHNGELAKALLATADDGYQILYSIGEIAPDFGNATIILALEVDGKPLPQGFEIVVQGDKRGARALHNINRIELR